MGTGGSGAGVIGNGFIGVQAVPLYSGGYGLYASQNLGSYAGFFSGHMNVDNGNSTHSGSGTKSFRIDHPVHPETKMLLHACVESPEQKNIYDGAGHADENGELAVELPSYFEALNTNHRYQLTALGSPAPDLHIKSQIRGNRFVIGGALAGQQISWQVTGTRHDPTSTVLPFVAEQDKSEEERGLYFCPEAYRQPPERGISRAIPRRRDDVALSRSSTSLLDATAENSLNYRQP